MSDKKVRACARVTVTVEFAVGGSVWGEGFTIEQINKQAREGALDILRRGLIVEGLVNKSERKTPATIVGEPKLVCILTESLE